MSTVNKRRKITAKEFLAIIPILEEVLKQFVNVTDIKIVIDVDTLQLDEHEGQDDEGLYNQAG